MTSWSTFGRRRDAVYDARGSAVAAIDGDSGTTWVADPDRQAPVALARVDRDPDRPWPRPAPRRQAAASRVTEVVLEYPGGRQTVKVDDEGHARVKPFRADRVDLYLTADVPTDNLASRRQSGDARNRGQRAAPRTGVGLLPVTLSDEPGRPRLRLRPDGARRRRASTRPRSPPRRASSSTAGVLPARVCGPDELAVGAGETRVLLSSAPAFRGVQAGDDPRAGASRDRSPRRD